MLIILNFTDFRTQVSPRADSFDVFPKGPLEKTSLLDVELSRKPCTWILLPAS